MISTRRRRAGVVELPVHAELRRHRVERRLESLVGDAVDDRLADDAHEEAAGVDVVVLGGLEDVAALAGEERRHRRDDAGAVGAGKGEDGSHRVRPAVMRGWEVGIGCGGPCQRHNSRVACRSTWSVGSASQKARSAAVRERPAQPAVAMRTRPRNSAFMSQRQAAQELPTLSAPNGPAGGFVGEPTFRSEAVGQTSFALGHPRCSSVRVSGRNRCKNAPQDTLILNKLRQFILGQHPGARRGRPLLQIKLRVSPAHAPGRIVQCGNASDTAPPVAGGSQLREHSPKAHLATRAWRRKPSGAPA